MNARANEKQKKQVLGKNQFFAKKKQKREEKLIKKKQSSSQEEKKGKTTRVDTKNQIMSADELKQRGNEAFKRNEFKLACEIFTEAIGLDSRNHVLYSNRSAARVILILCIFCAHTVVYIFEAFFDRLHLFEKKITFSRQKRMKKWLFSRDHRKTLFVVALALVLGLVHHQNRVCFCSRSQQ